MYKLSKKTTLHKAKNLQEVQYILNNVSNVIPIAGATGFLNGQTDEILSLPEQALDLNSLAELKHITKTERYFEFGALVTLNEILELGRRNIPTVLYDAIEKVGNHTLRSLASIGGNIAEANPAAGLFLPMIALDAKIEIKNAKETEWIPFSKYIDESFTAEREKNFIITRIRIPNEKWNKVVFNRIGNDGLLNEESASFLFAIQLHKNILSDMRLLFAGKNLIKEKEFDNLLLGISLPINERDVMTIIQKARSIFKRDIFDSDYHYTVFFNLLEDNLYKLS